MKIRKIDGHFAAVWSDQEIADASGVSRPSITRWRTGERDPGWSKVKEIEEATGLPFEVFESGRHKTLNDLEAVKKRLYEQLSTVIETIETIRDAEDAGKDGKERKKRSKNN